MKCSSLAHPIDELETYLFGHVSREQAEAIEAHFSICRACREKLDETRNYVEDIRAALVLLAISAADEYCDMPIERREAPRTACDTPVVVSYRIGMEVAQLVARLIDTSAGGGGLLLDEALPVDVSACIQISDWELTGTVKYCHKGPDGFHAGVELTDVFPLAA